MYQAFKVDILTQFLNDKDNRNNEDQNGANTLPDLKMCPGMDCSDTIPDNIPIQLKTVLIHYATFLKIGLIFIWPQKSVSWSSKNMIGTRLSMLPRRRNGQLWKLTSRISLNVSFIFMKNSSSSYWLGKPMKIFSAGTASRPI